MTPDTSRSQVTESEIKAFERDGALCLRGVLDFGWVERMRAAVDRITANPGPMRETYSPDKPGQFFSEKFLWTFDEDFRYGQLACSWRN